MPDSCCAVGCSNKRVKGGKLKFYRIPFGHNEESKKLRQLWVQAIKREKCTEKQIDNARICSEHFISGEKSKDLHHPDYVPSKFAYKKEGFQQQKLHRFERVQKRRMSSTSSHTDTDADFDTSVDNVQNDAELCTKSSQTEVTLEKLQQEIFSLQKERNSKRVIYS